MKNNINTYKAIWILIGVALIGLILLKNDPALVDIKNRAENFFTEELQRSITTPSPLFGPMENRESTLTSEGIIQWTNKNRVENGLSPLSVNTKLNTAADLKAKDMLERQYFAHETPTGENVDDFAAAAGYDFIIIGENLALGNFKNDEVLVQAWMDSPGHRENILGKGYMEIGIGLARGMYEGNEVWLAVQHFGKPSSACVEPNKALLSEIDSNKAQLSVWEEEMEQRRQDIENTPRNHPSYNRKVREYNELVERYNKLSQDTKALVNQYNEGVRAFNACAKS